MDAGTELLVRDEVVQEGNCCVSWNVRFVVFNFGRNDGRDSAKSNSSLGHMFLSKVFALVLALSSATQQQPT